VRVRRVQVHGREVETASAGQRTALNLTGADRHPAARGDLLATRGRLAASSVLDVRIEMLPALARGLAQQQRIRFFTGTAECDGRVRILDDTRLIAPGEAGFAQIRLGSPLAAAVGDRFILRRPSPALTLGGGEILDPAPRKHRRGDPALVARLARLATSDTAGKVTLFLDEAGERGLRLDELVVRTGAAHDVVGGELSRLARGASGLLRGRSGDAVMAQTAAGDIVERMRGLLNGFHQEQPLARGMSLAELRSRAAPHTPESLVEAILSQAGAAGLIRIEGRVVAAAEHRILLTAEEQALLDQVVEQVRGGGLDPADPHGLLVEQGCDAARADALVRLQEESGVFLRIGKGYLLHHDVLDDLKSRLWSRRESDPVIDMASFKELAGVTRRRAIPLLEYLDATHVTTRRGDRRVIQPPGEPTG
ncbi:MAG: SelB C-terminal domain-containing protein, partial [Acidobacteriota bacterium]